MIQLANDPNASRNGQRSGPNDGKPSNFGPQRGRSSHAWPFLSRYAGRPVQQQDKHKPTASDSGS
jgi:hypothetical protein